VNILFWNIRGLDSKGRKAQLKKILFEHKVNCVCISESIKQNFTAREVTALGRGNSFTWNWVPSQGHSGGLLLGIDDEIFEVSDYQDCNHFRSIMLT